MSHLSLVGVKSKKEVVPRSLKFPGHSWKAGVYTFSNVVENHIGMQKIGEKGEGLTREDVTKAANFFLEKGADLYLLNLGDESKSGIEGSIVLIKNGVDYLGGDVDKIWKQTQDLGVDGVDTTFYNSRRKVVQNKNARWNFNVADEDQSADMEKGKGTVHSFEKLDELKKVREGLGEIGIAKTCGLLAEANIYYSDDTGIGFHGDAERNIVIGVCMGKDRVIEWQAFSGGFPIGDRITLTLSHGDVYMMDEAASGHGWSSHAYKSDHYRHRAGFKKWLDREERANQKKWRERREKDVEKAENVSGKRKANVNTLPSKKRRV